MDISQAHRDKLGDIKHNIETAHKYFKSNYDRFNEFYYFTYVNTLTDKQIASLKVIGKPPVSFNILDAFVSRLRGEFMSNQPSVSVRASDGVMPWMMDENFTLLQQVIEAHLREIIFSANNDQLSYQVYTDLLVGGFSVVEVYTDYVNSMSFLQNIYTKRVEFPTMCFFDPRARESHKGDGDFCGKIFTMTKDEFKCAYGDNVDTASYVNGIGGFTWAYNDGAQDIILVAEYYTKVKRKEKIVKLTNGRTVKYKEYKKMAELYNELVQTSQMLLPMPEIVQDRMSDFVYIDRYTICANEVLKYERTDYDFLPYIFFSGDSAMVQKASGGEYFQFTKPYTYHAKGIQQMKDFAGQTWISDIENMIMSKWKMPVEGMPEEYKDNYLNPQEASVILYNSFANNDPALRVNAPEIIQRDQLPSMVENAFMVSDRLTQTILGSYDAQLGIQGSGLSGVAIQQGAMQSSEAADPYLMGYIRGLNRVAEVITAMIPKIYVTPRSIPIQMPDGKRTYKIINSKEQQQPDMQGKVNDDSQKLLQARIFMNYDPKDLLVKVEATSSYAVQKQVALAYIEKLVTILPGFREFLDTRGMEVILDNIEFRGSDRMKVLYAEFMQDYTQRQAQASQMQQAMTQTDMQLKVDANERANKQQQAEQTYKAADMFIQQEAQQNKSAVDSAKVAIENKKVGIDMLNALGNMKVSNAQAKAESQRIDAENARTATELAIKNSEHELEKEKHLVDMISTLNEQQRQEKLDNKAQTETNDGN